MRREEITADDKVFNFQEEQAAILGRIGSEIEESVHVPDIASLADKTSADIAAILTTVLKSRRDITGLLWERSKPYVTIRYIKH